MYVTFIAWKVMSSGFFFHELVIKYLALHIFVTCAFINLNSFIHVHENDTSIE